MDRYNRAYRDPKSPLTPLTPLSSNTAFNFDFGGDNSLKSFIEKIEFNTPNGSIQKLRTPKRFQEGFLKIREVFEKQQALTSNKTKDTTPKQSRRNRSPMYEAQNENVYLDVPELFGSISAQVQQKLTDAGAAQKKLIPELQQLQKIFTKHFRKAASPIPMPPLSPRVAKLLTKAGMARYRDLFQKEEIDMDIFRTLSEKDLADLGIINAEDQKGILNVIRLAYEHF